MAALIFEGPPGVGKTFSGTAIALVLLKRRKVAVNWNMTPLEGQRHVCVRWMDNHNKADKDGVIDDPCHLEHLSIAAVNSIPDAVLIRYQEFNEADGLTDVDVLNDEAQATAGARDWESMSKRTRLWLSMHRHFRTNLLFLTQHYKFVDVYFRRLATGDVFTLWRLFNMTWILPRPLADSETGELGMGDIFGMYLIWRPWKTLDHPWPMPKFWELLKASLLVPSHYQTHQPKEKETKKKSAAPPAAQDGGAARSDQKALPF